MFPTVSSPPEVSPDTEAPHWSSVSSLARTRLAAAEQSKTASDWRQHGRDRLHITDSRLRHRAYRRSEDIGCVMWINTVGVLWKNSRVSSLAGRCSPRRFTRGCCRTTMRSGRRRACSRPTPCRCAALRRPAGPVRRPYPSGATGRLCQRARPAPLGEFFCYSEQIARIAKATCAPAPRLHAPR